MEAPAVDAARATAGDGAHERWTRAALHLLADRGTVPPTLPARPVLWEIRPERVLVGCETPMAPEPSHLAGPGTRPRCIDVTPAAASRRPDDDDLPDAALATVEAESDRRVLVDFLAARVTTLTGDPGDCAAYLRSVVDELAARRFAPLGELVVVGMDDLSAHAPEGPVTTRVGRLAEVDCFLLAPAREGDGGDRRTEGPGRTRKSRAVLVVVGPGATEDVARLDQLVALAGEDVTSAGQGDPRAREIAVVIGASWPGARCTLVVGPRRNDVFVKATLDRRLGEEARVAFPSLTSRSKARDAQEQHERAGGAEDPGGAGGAVEVAVLGRVEVRGVAGSLARRPKLTELVVFLALHPEGATTSAWSTALWPHRRVPGQTIANRLSEARRLLGFAPDDRPRLRRNGELYVLSDVSSDWARFKQLSHRDRDVSSWNAALQLVRGRPFEDLPSTLWTAIECTAAEIEHAVTDCALRCGEALLDGGDYEGAAAAAYQGLRAVPWDERLHRLLMLTADATGNRAGVDATLRHLALALEVDGDPLQHVHRDTASLYELLAGRSPIQRP
ncbi:MAG: AfsR/SARP family transcriptional regulator [Acidimicrobiales bacterium]